MSKTEFFLDTNLIIDWIENRNRTTVTFLSELMGNQKISLATSFYNLIEAIDKIQEIRHIGKLILHNKYSFDEIIRAKREKNLDGSDRQKIMSDINSFLEEMKVTVYSLQPEEHSFVADLIANVNVESQDAFIVSTYHFSSSQVFISNDERLIKSVKDKIVNCFHLKSNLSELRANIGSL